MNKIKRFLWVITLCLSVALNAQSDTSHKGIKWTTSLSWEQVKQKAKQENKYIFVDCYATWCAPCKAMEKNVYPEEKVGAAINGKFIAVKIQMDKTDKDDEKVKSWYKDAKVLDEEYEIAAYPTLLFFASDGSLVHRVTQGLNVDGFIDVVQTALDPKKRYYSRLEEYKNGNKDTTFLKDLIKAAQAAYDNKTAEKIAEEYFSRLNPKSLRNRDIRDLVRQFGNSPMAIELASNYINLLKDQELFAKENIEFIRHFTKTSKQKGFKIFYNYPERINKVMDAVPLQPGLFSFISHGDYAQSAVRAVIYNEEIFEPIFRPAIKDSSKTADPDWTFLTLSIHKKYPKTQVERIIVDFKVKWYGWKKNWREFSKNLLQQMDDNYKGKSLVGLTFTINNNCWSLFEKSTDTVVLNKAIHWMEEAFRQNEKDRKWGTAIDTYANLLYKIGRVKEALEWEAKAVECEPDNEDIQNAFEKMKKNEPTW